MNSVPFIGMDIRHLWRQLSDAITTVTGSNEVTDRDLAIVRAMHPSGIVTESSDGTSAEVAEANRDRNMSDFYWSIDDMFWMADQDDFGGYHYLRDVYVQDGSSDLFAITVSDGKLFQFPVSLNSADEIELGDPQQVQMQFAPVERAMTVMRGDDGVYRALAVLSTAVLNRCGEIDSTALYDTFVERFQGDERVNFHHTEVEFGTLRMIRRSDYVLWGVIEFDDTEIGRAAAENIMADEAGDWGISIEFLYEPDAVELIDVSGVQIPVYESGTLTRASILKSRKAAAWFTAIPSADIVERSKTVNKSIKSDLAQLVGDDLVDKAAELDTEINSRAVDENMVRRESETPPTGEVEESSPAEESPNQAADENGAEVIEVDDSLVDVLISGVTNSDAFTAIQDTIGTLQAQLNEALANVAELVTANDEMAGELRSIKERQGEFEAGYDERVDQFVASAPPTKRYVLAGQQERSSATPAQPIDMNDFLANRLGTGVGK